MSSMTSSKNNWMTAVKLGAVIKLYFDVETLLSGLRNELKFLEKLRTPFGEIASYILKSWRIKKQ